MTWAPLNWVYDPIARYYSGSFLTENGLDRTAPADTIRTGLEGRLTSGQLHRNYDILTNDDIARYGLPAATTPSAPETRGSRFNFSFNPLRPIQFNKKERQEVVRALEEIRQEYARVNAHLEEGIERVYLTPQEVGVIADKCDAKSARAAVRQIAIDAGYVASLNFDHTRYVEEVVVAPAPAPGPGRAEEPEEDDADGGRRPSEDLPAEGGRKPIHALDCRFGRSRENTEGLTTWHYDDIYNVSRSLKGSDLEKTIIGLATYGTLFGVTAATGGLAAGAIALGTSYATRKVVQAGTTALMNQALPYITDRDATQLAGATTGAWAMAGANFLREYLTCAPSIVVYPLLGVAGLVTVGALAHYASKKIELNTEEQRNSTGRRFAKGGLTAVSGLADKLIPASFLLPRVAHACSDGGNSPSQNSAPIIDDFSVNHGNASHIGVNSYKFDVHDKPAFGDHIEKVEVVQQNPDGSIVSGTTYPVGFLERMQHFFGDSSITEKDTFTASQPGTYNFAITATDSFGASTTEHFSVPVGGNGESTPVPTPGPEPFDYSQWDIRRIYDDHGHFTGKCAHNYVGGAAHENGMTFNEASHKGHIDFNFQTQGDAHTKDLNNFDDTKVVFEGYTKSSSGTVLTDAYVVDVDANGNFVLPQSVHLNDYSGYQVIWADVAQNDASHTLCVEALASVSHGNYCAHDYIVEAEEMCNGGHALVPHHDAPAVLHPAPVDNNIHYYRIAPVPDHGAFLLNITDNKFDGLNNTTELYNGSTLVQWSQDTFAPGTTTAIVGGHYPVDLAPGQYTVHSWGHDNPNIAWDNQQFTVDATQQHVAPAPMLDRMNPVSSEGLDAFVTQETPVPAEQPAVPNPTNHIAPSNDQFINVESLHGDQPAKAPEAPTNNCGCNGSHTELFVQDKEEAFASTSFEDLLRFWQERYTLVESSANTTNYKIVA